MKTIRNILKIISIVTALLITIVLVVPIAISLQLIILVCSQLLAILATAVHVFDFLFVSHRYRGKLLNTLHENFAKFKHLFIKVG